MRRKDFDLALEWKKIIKNTWKKAIWKRRKSPSRRGGKFLSIDRAVNKAISDSTKYKDLPILRKKKRKKK